MVRFFVLVALIAAPAADAARPTDTRATARIVWTHQARDTVIVGNSAWRCAADACSGPAIDTKSGKLRSCRELRRAAGRVVSFETPSGALDAEALARCNKRG